MKKYLFLIILFSIFMSGCSRQNPINFSSSEAFFSSLNEKKIIQKRNKNKNFSFNNSQKSKINMTDKQKTKNTLSLTLSTYEKQLKQKINLDEFSILKIFKNPSLKIKHGKIKNLQFHLKSCHLDLFFLNDDKTYKFKHFDIRPSAMLSNLNKKKCVQELNNKFTLIHGPK